MAEREGRVLLAQDAAHTSNVDKLILQPAREGKPCWWGLRESDRLRRLWDDIQPGVDYALFMANRQVVCFAKIVEKKPWEPTLGSVLMDFPHCFRVDVLAGPGERQRTHPPLPFPFANLCNGAILSEEFTLRGTMFLQTDKSGKIIERLVPQGGHSAHRGPNGPTAPKASAAEEGQRERARQAQARRSRAEVARGLLVEAETLDTMVELLSWSPSNPAPQLVLHGPSGGGKSFMAKRLARYVAGKADRVTTVVLNSSSSYFTHILGLQQRVEHGSPRFTATPGPIMVAILKAIAYPANQHVLVIDEANRCELDAVMGDLMLLLEKRTDTTADRPGASRVDEVELPYAIEERVLRPFGEHAVRWVHRGADPARLVLPRNLSLIVTMNDFDTHLDRMSRALVDRFWFVRVPDSAATGHGNVAMCPVGTASQRLGRYLRSVALPAAATDGAVSAFSEVAAMLRRAALRGRVPHELPSGRFMLPVANASAEELGKHWRRLRHLRLPQVLDGWRLSDYDQNAVLCAVDRMSDALTQPAPALAPTAEMKQEGGGGSAAAAAGAAAPAHNGEVQPAKRRRGGS